MKKTILSVSLLVTCMFLGACGGGNSNSRNNIVVTTSLSNKPTLVGNVPCNFPLVNEETTLNIMTAYNGKTPAEDIFVWNQYEQMTGIKVNWTNVKKGDRAESVYTALTNKTDLDLIMRCKIDSNLLRQYGENGLLYDLAKDDLLKTWAPNCWAYLQSHVDALASVTNPDGSIYALPQVNSGAELRVAKKLFINKQWLENVHMDIPTTTEELYQLLKAFKEQDANGNGDSSDEIPLCIDGYTSFQEALAGAFGFNNRGFHNEIVDFDEENQVVRLTATSDDYRNYLEYANKLYCEGLLNDSIFSIKSDEWLNNASTDRIGIFSNTNLASLPSGLSDNWVAIEEALEGPTGDKQWNAIRANFHSTGAAVIPTTCENPELVLQWLDYFWTDEGTLFYHMGIENKTFLANDDGTYAYSPEIYQQINEQKTFDEVVSNYSPYPGGSNPTVEIAPYFMGGEMEAIPANAARKLFEYGPREYWPSFTFTAEENEELSVVQTDIVKYCNVATIDFITGTKPFSEWDSYVEQVNQLGCDKMLSIYQAALDRYNKLKESNK